MRYQLSLGGVAAVGTDVGDNMDVADEGTTNLAEVATTRPWRPRGVRAGRRLKKRQGDGGDTEQWPSLQLPEQHRGRRSNPTQVQQNLPGKPNSKHTAQAGFDASSEGKILAHQVCRMPSA
ncbi:hypothetical protein ABBQ32_010900 [Trebouxia sp. C0010 RCD-2024]